MKTTTSSHLKNITVALFLFVGLFHAAAFTIEDRVQCTQNLNVRATPSTSGTLVTTEASGSRGIIIDGPQSANGFTWWRITWDNGYTGWSVQDYLTLVTWYSLNIASSNPNSGVNIMVGPNDFLGHADGTTSFTRFFDAGTSVTLIAPATASGNNFVKWTRNGSDYNTSRTIEFSMSASYNMVAVYAPAPPVTRTLTVSSSNPNSGVSISGNQLDNNNNAGGTTTFNRVFNQNASVSFNAPATAGGNTFQKWQKNGADLTTSTTASVTMDANHTITAVYTTPTTYTISTSVSPVGAGTASGGGTVTAGQSVTVIASPNPSYAFVNWTESGSQVSASASYNFTANASRSLVANFQSSGGACPLNTAAVGVTVITHGYQQFAGLPDWTTDMASEIRARLGLVPPVFTLRIVADGLGAKLVAGQSLDISQTGSAIIVVDWSEVAGGPLFYTSSEIIGDLVFDFFENNPTLLQVPLHLVGHSRGTSVNSRFAWRLAGFGIVVDHVTTLDPQPVTLYLQDFEVESWSNILFADNYYRNDGSLPRGEFVAGAFTQPLNSIVTGASDGIAHEQVHSFYHGTIPIVDISGTFVDGVMIQPSWYDDSLSPTRLPRSQTGFALSKGKPNGLALRPVQGKHPSVLNGTASRVGLTASPSVSALPNVALEDFQIIGGSYTVRVGESVIVRYYYQDADSSMTVTLRKDDDTNPLNDPNDSCHATIGGPFTHQANANAIGATNIVWTPTVNDVGSFRLQAKATDGGRTRYDYLTTPITVIASNTAPDVTVISTVSAPSSAAAGSSINVGYTLKNIGNGASGTFGVRVSLGTTAYGTQIPLADFSTASLTPNETRAENRTVTIPDGTTSGSYYVTVYADGPAPGVVTESNEGNNVGSSTPSQISISVPVYAISTVASPVGGGTASGGGNYTRGANVTVQATANSGYHFLNWTENAVPVSTSTSYSFTANTSRALTANFEADAATYTLTISAVNGSVTKNPNQASYSAGTQVTLTPSAAGGFYFSGWSGDASGNANPLIVTMNANKTITANFAANPVNYSITVNASPVNGGTVNGGGTFASGSFRTVTATPNAGFSFLNWTESGSEVSASTSYGFTLNGNRNLVGNFIAVPPPATNQLTGMNLSNSIFSFTLNGPAGSNYVIQTSSNLVNWVNRFIKTIPGGGSVTVTEALAGDSRRYYRAVANDQGPFVLQPGPLDGNDIWTTSTYSYAPGGSTPGGGLNNHVLRIGGLGRSVLLAITV